MALAFPFTQIWFQLIIQINQVLNRSVDKFCTKEASSSERVFIQDIVQGDVAVGLFQKDFIQGREPKPGRSSIKTQPFKENFQIPAGEDKFCEFAVLGITGRVKIAPSGDEEPVPGSEPAETLLVPGSVRRINRFNPVDSKNDNFFRFGIFQQHRMGEHRQPPEFMDFSDSGYRIHLRARNVSRAAVLEHFLKDFFLRVGVPLADDLPGDRPPRDACGFLCKAHVQVNIEMLSKLSLIL